MTKLTRLADKQSKTDFSFGKSLFLVKKIAVLKNWQLIMCSETVLAKFIMFCYNWIKVKFSQ